MSIFDPDKIYWKRDYSFVLYSILSKKNQENGIITFKESEIQLAFTDQSTISITYESIVFVQLNAGNNSFLFNSMDTGSAPISKLSIHTGNGDKFDLFIGFYKIGLELNKEPNNLYELLELLRTKSHRLYVLFKDTIEINYFNQKRFSGKK